MTNKGRMQACVVVSKEVNKLSVTSCSAISLHNTSVDNVHCRREGIA